MAGEDKEKKQAGLGGLVFVGCLMIGLGCRNRVQPSASSTFHWLGCRFYLYGDSAP